MVICLELGPFSGTTQVSRYQKDKTNLDFTEARDSEWQWHQLGYMQVCTSLQTDNHASTPPLTFYRPDALPAAQPTASKHWRQLNKQYTLYKCSGWPQQLQFCSSVLNLFYARDAVTEKALLLIHRSVCTILSVLFILPNWHTYVHLCMPVFPLVPSDSPTLICSLLCLSIYHLVLTASALQPLKSGTLSFYLSVPVPVLTPSVVISRPTTASRLSNPLNPSPLAPQIRLFLTIMHVYNLYLLT